MAIWDGERWEPLRAQAAQRSAWRTTDGIATAAMLVGICALLVGGSARAAVAPLDLDPHTGVPGAMVWVTAYGLPPLTSVQLEWDGSTAGMPKTRTSKGGALAVRFEIPVATVGTHQVRLRAGLTGHGRKTASITAGTLLAAGIFVVSGSAVTSSPSAPDSISSAPRTSPAPPAPTSGTPRPTPGPASPSWTATPTPVPASPAPLPASPTPFSAAPPSTTQPSPFAAATPSSSIPTPTPSDPPEPGDTTWLTVVNDQFESGGVPAHWGLYDGPYGSAPRNCATPSHVSVSGGAMRMLMRYESSGRCGAGWYTAGMYAKVGSSVDQRITVRFRVVSNGVAAHRIIPMRWPTGGTWPQDGEEDYCEGSALTHCWTFLHYGTSNSQLDQKHSFDLTQWHTLRFERLNFVIRAYIDDLINPVWTYAGSSTTLPATLKHVVLQQECQGSGCPAGVAGTEEIQIDWITIEVPSD